MFYLLLATYGTVLFAELLGDKSFYTISSLTTRFRPAHVLGGISIAFAGKMLVAVLLGQAIAGLPPALVASVSAATFFTTALVIWFKKPRSEKPELDAARRWPRAATVSFAAIFLTEWGDVGQIAAATLVASYHAPFIIWLGATSAMMTKGLLAITLGIGLRDRIPQSSLRYGAFAMCLVMGILAALRID
jgi:putative Ca2+/H+ antiporter (TMEM165/GDT1 family)